MESWADGHLTSAMADQTALLTANALGQCEVLKSLLTIDLEQLLPEQSND